MDSKTEIEQQAPFVEFESIVLTPFNTNELPEVDRRILEKINPRSPENIVMFNFMPPEYSTSGVPEIGTVERLRIRLSFFTSLKKVYEERRQLAQELGSESTILHKTHRQFAEFLTKLPFRYDIDLGLSKKPFYESHFTDADETVYSQEGKFYNTQTMKELLDALEGSIDAIERAIEETQKEINEMSLIGSARRSD